VYHANNVDSSASLWFLPLYCVEGDKSHLLYLFQEAEESPIHKVCRWSDEPCLKSV